MKTPTFEMLDRIVRDSLFTDEEVSSKVHEQPGSMVKGEGLTAIMGFHPERLARHRDEVKEMLEALPDTFKTTGGGGMSFLNACMTQSGEQWGGQREAEILFILGNALGFVIYPLPREFWHVLPGGVPYVTINLEEVGDDEG